MNRHILKSYGMLHLQVIKVKVVYEYFSYHIILPYLDSNYRSMVNVD